MKLAPRLCQILLCLWVVSIPWSLALSLDKNAGYVHGFLVDYRIPALCASTLFLVFALLGVVLTKQTGKQILQSIKLGLGVAFWMQFLFALLQFLTQKSLTGYLPFGEVALLSPQVAKGVFGNGMLLRLPYGTTLHPNILSGFMVISFFLWRLLVPKHKTNTPQLLAVILMCALTQSLGSILALAFGLILLVITRNDQVLIKLSRLAIITLPLISYLIFLSPAAIQSPNPSVSRRAKLQQIARSMIANHPLSGVGWNNFTLYQEEYGVISGSTRFLQPPHHVFLLLITELGIIGWMLIVLIVRMIWKVSPQFLPLMGVLVLSGSLDHYLLTINTGRMLCLLCLMVCFSRNPKK